MTTSKLAVQNEKELGCETWPRGLSLFLDVLSCQHMTAMQQENCLEIWVSLVDWEKNRLLGASTCRKVRDQIKLFGWRYLCATLVKKRRHQEMWEGVYNFIELCETCGTQQTAVCDSILSLYAWSDSLSEESKCFMSEETVKWNFIFEWYLLSRTNSEIFCTFSRDYRRIFLLWKNCLSENT